MSQQFEVCIPLSEIPETQNKEFDSQIREMQPLDAVAPEPDKIDKPKKQPKEPKDPNKVKEPKEPKDPNKVKEPKDPNKVKEPKQPKEPKDPNKVKEPKQPKQPKQLNKDVPHPTYVPPTPDSPPPSQVEPRTPDSPPPSQVVKPRTPDSPPPSQVVEPKTPDGPPPTENKPVKEPRKRKEPKEPKEPKQRKEPRQPKKVSKSEENVEIILKDINAMTSISITSDKTISKKNMEKVPVYTLKLPDTNDSDDDELDEISSGNTRRKELSPISMPYDKNDMFEVITPNAKGAANIEFFIPLIEKWSNGKFCTLVRTLKGTQEIRFVRLTGSYDKDTKSFPCEFVQQITIFKDNKVDHVLPVWTNVAKTGLIEQEKIFNLIPYSEDEVYSLEV